MDNPLKQRFPLTRIASVLSLWTLAAYHIPCFRLVTETIEEADFNGVMIFVGLVILMLTLNFLVYYLVLFLGRTAGKVFLALTLVGDAIALYFINTYQVLINDQMMGNVFNTRYSEASGFFSGAAVAYVVLLGILPAIGLLLCKVDYGTWKRFGARTGCALVLSLTVALVNMPNWPWVDRQAPKLGSLLLPWSYTVNSVRCYNSLRERNRKEIPLPDIERVTPGKDLCVLVIGESARRANFSLYGYERPTNPLLERDSVIALPALSAATYTTAGVKAMLDHRPTGKLYEILPNYLFRNGVEVIWRSNNWGEPPLHIEHYADTRDLKARHPEADERYDGILLAGLREEIDASDRDKVLVVLHTSTSHGPTYYKKYPPEFERFNPVCTTVEMAKADPAELINAYDNTIVYTDYLVHSVIELLRTMPERRSCVLFVSDHGESLGEKNLYMHGVPMAIAPREQIEIPFIVWSSDPSLLPDPTTEVSQYHVFHSVLSFLGLDSPVYDPSLDIFRHPDPHK